MTVTSLLDRRVYLYAEVDRLVGLRSGTARRWINGYTRSGREYDPILRERGVDTEWVTWGEFVETRMLAEYRDQNIPTQHLRGAVDQLRQLFQVPYPLATLRPYLESESGELAMSMGHIDGGEGTVVVRTGQLLLTGPSRTVMNHAALGTDEHGERFAEEIRDLQFQGVVLNPQRLSGQPTFTGRRLSVAMIGQLIANGEASEDIASDYGLSLAEVAAAAEYTALHRLSA